MQQKGQNFDCECDKQEDKLAQVAVKSFSWWRNVMLSVIHVCSVEAVLQRMSVFVLFGSSVDCGVECRCHPSPCLSG